MVKIFSSHTSEQGKSLVGVDDDDDAVEGADSGYSTERFRDTPARSTSNGVGSVREVAGWIRRHWGMRERVRSVAEPSTDERGPQRPVGGGPRETANSF